MAHIDPKVRTTSFCTVILRLPAVATTFGYAFFLERADFGSSGSNIGLIAR